MAKRARKEKISSSMMMMPDWSQLLEELLHHISTFLENCCDVIHARSVCSMWRSSIPFPCCLLCPSYSLPSFSKYPLESKDLCTLEKIPLFSFNVRAPARTSRKFFQGGIFQDESNDHIKLSSPLQCSVKVKTKGSDPSLINMLDCRIVSLGFKYRLISLEDPKDLTRGYRSVAVLRLKREGGGRRVEFVVLHNYTRDLLVLTSADMRWKRLENVPDCLCNGVVAFNGRFYATLVSGDILDIDPYSLQCTVLL